MTERTIRRPTLQQKELILGAARILQRQAMPEPHPITRSSEDYLSVLLERLETAERSKENLADLARMHNEVVSNMQREIVALEADAKRSTQQLDAIVDLERQYCIEGDYTGEDIPIALVLRRLQDAATMATRKHMLESAAAAQGDVRSAVAMRCELPPPDWECSRPSGHEGPCAARPVSDLSHVGAEIHEKWRAEDAFEQEYKAARAADDVEPYIAWDEEDYEVAEFVRKCSSTAVGARRVRLLREQETRDAECGGYITGEVAARKRVAQQILEGLGPKDGELVSHSDIERLRMRMHAWLDGKP